MEQGYLVCHQLDKGQHGSRNAASLLELCYFQINSRDPPYMDLAVLENPKQLVEKASDSMSESSSRGDLSPSSSVHLELTVVTPLTPLQFSVLIPQIEITSLDALTVA